MHVLMFQTVCESGRSTHLSVVGDQTGNISVRNQEETGLGLQILPQVGDQSPHSPIVCTEFLSL